MNEERPQQIIRKGISPRTDAGAIGGSECYVDDNKVPTVLLALAPKDGPSGRVELHEGDTFELGPELWEVTKIDDPDTSFWTAVLTRLR